jgi:hypothetical protein
LLGGTSKGTVPAEQPVFRFPQASGRTPDHSNQNKTDGILRPNQALEQKSFS